MRKVLTIFVAILLLMMLVTIAGGYWLLQSAYLTNITNYLLKQYISTPISIYQVKYDYPNYLLLEGVEIEQQQPIYIEKTEIWFNSDTITKRHPVIDSVLLNGMSLQHGMPELPQLNHVELHQLAIDNLDYSDNNLIVRGARIQIENPELINQEQIIPFGTIQFSAEQIYWQQEAFNQILIDIDYKKHDSTLYGASFEWRDARFSGQAEQYKQGWSLINVTIDKLNLSNEQWLRIKNGNWSLLSDNIYHINNLDMLNSTLSSSEFQISNGHLSLENISLRQDFWHQNKGYISFSADSFSYQNHRIIDPAFKSNLNNNLINVSDLHFEFEQGLVQASVEISPDSLALQQLNINGVKWIYESDKDFSFIHHYLSQLEQLTIEHLKIRHSQFIQLAHQPNWQISGLSADGKALTIIQKAKLGLWQGSANISADNVSYKQLLSSQPLINMSSHNGIWTLNEAFIPLERGLITATADFHFSHPSQPWRVEASVDGLPIELLTPALSLPVEIEAIAELQASLTGLGSDSLMLNHSFSGQMVGSLRHLKLFQNQKLEKSDSDFIPLENTRFSLTADRGRIVIDPVVIKAQKRRTNLHNKDTLSGRFYGYVDLLNEPESEILLKLNHGCSAHTFDFFNHSQKTENLCDK